MKKLRRRLLNLLPDPLYLKMRFYSEMGYRLNLKNPQTFNEKLQWLKLYDRKPEYTMMVDKYAVKKYVAEKIGEEYVIPTLGVWDRFEEIDFDRLPEQFVLKCTHDSGGVIICRDKKNFDIEAAKKKLNASLRRNYYYPGREWPYKNVKPRIIAEKYMVDESGYELKDYKIFCFDGEPRIIQVDYNRFIDHKRNLYSTEWKLLEMEICYPSDKNILIEKPKCLDKMLDMSRILSSGIPNVRCDFYLVEDKLYFGELTFYHGSGYERFNPQEWDRKLGEWIHLPEKEI